jgi:hypothetical protein
MLKKKKAEQDEGQKSARRVGEIVPLFCKVR